MGKEWVYFFRLSSICLSHEKGGQILFPISCGLKSVQSILNWYSFFMSHRLEQPSGATVSSFKTHDAHIFTYTLLPSHAIWQAEIGHTCLCSLMLWCNTSSRGMFYSTWDGLCGDMSPIKGQGLTPALLYTLKTPPRPAVVDKLACTGNHPQRPWVSRGHNCNHFPRDEHSYKCL